MTYCSGQGASKRAPIFMLSFLSHLYKYMIKELNVTSKSIVIKYIRIIN